MVAYNPIFEPIAKVGEYLAVYPTDKYGYYKINYICQLPEIVKDFGSLNATSSTGDIKVTELYMDDGFIGQWRIIPLDDIIIEAKQPLAKSLWTTRNKTASISLRSLKTNFMSGVLEVFIFEDEEFYLNITNPTNYTQPKNRVLFTGFKYSISKLEAPPEKFTTIPVEAL